MAAENFYGDVAQQVAGSNATVASILSNPDQDPHLFEASPSVARLLSAATIVVYNGADYDPWMAKLLAASRSPNRGTIIVADLVHRKAGDNPHIWYDPPTMPAYAKALAALLAERDPGHKQDYQQRLDAFLASLQPMEAKIADLHSRFGGTAVTATEPVFGYMATALGLTMRNERFQLAVMNDTEPRVSDVAAFENDLRKHQVRLLFYNSQASSAAAQRLMKIAQQSKIPIVGVTETRTTRQDVSGLDGGRTRRGRAGLGQACIVSAVELNGATLAFGARTVLGGIDLEIRDSEFVGVLGPNGSGKTTLMRAILGLLRPRSGTIRVLGRPVARGNPAVGYMPQTRGALDNLRLSGWDFVASGANGHRWGLPLLRAVARREVQWALDMVDAAALARRPLAETSGGERQRLLLAQALLGRPRLLLLDEPLISLDPHHQRSVVELTRSLQKELGIAVLFSAHEINPLLSALDRVLYLGSGHAALGAVDEVISGPVLSRLYGSEIEVVRVNGRIFVMSGGYDVERDAHQHDHGEHHVHV